MPDIRAAFFDFGGVILSSPFEAFAEYERRLGLPDGLIRGLNSTNPDDNAWAQLERNQVSFDEFCRLYEGEAHAAGHRIDAREVMALLSGTVRPEMVGAVQRCKERLKTACLTNNFVSFDQFPKEAVADGRDEVLALFDVIIESSKVGVRKPDPRFYEIACEECGVEPHEAVFLDDLGINLKPAKAMGMTTIKVVDPDQALAELETAVGFPVR
ncbi:MAG TPA: HAD-IA family hydrolase [Acidimicrobiales bacterium]|nr:HAD-IA family hydrolase [Acidimicrobiales bacterium]